MIKSRTFTVIALAVGTFCVLVSPAFGEFEAKESKGKGENTELKLEAGGAKVVCQAFAESISTIAWTIENEGKAATKGPSLILDIEKWGECTAESGELKEVKAELSSCELEIKQPKAETEVSARILKTCTIKASTCEIKLEAKENEGLKHLNILSAGAENENLILEPAVSNVATTIGGTCPGIKATKEAKLSGLLELNGIKSAALGQFSVSTTPKNYNALVLTGKVKITNKGAEQKPAGWIRATRPAGSFSANAMEEKTCETKMYKKGESCEFNIKWESVRGFAFWTVDGANGVGTTGVVRGRP